MLSLCQGMRLTFKINSTHDVFWTPSGHDSCQAGEICNVPVGKSMIAYMLPLRVGK